MLSFLFIIAIIALFIASITDLKTREVPDWLNYALIFFGLGARLIYSIIDSNYLFFLYGVLGFAAFFLIAVFMYYTGQWGGGDSKLLMGLGAIIGLDFHDKIPFLVHFWINILVIGAIYGIVWSIWLAVRNWHAFSVQLAKINAQYKILKRCLLGALIVIILANFFVPAFFKIALLSLTLVLAVTYYLWISVTAVQRACMLKRIPPELLTEGDWIARDIMVQGKRIAGPKDLGATKDQIRKLIALKKQKKISYVLVKEGIPFVPSFFIAFLLTLIVGNIVFAITGITF